MDDTIEPTDVGSLNLVELMLKMTEALLGLVKDDPITALVVAQAVREFLALDYARSVSEEAEELLVATCDEMAMTLGSALADAYGGLDEIPVPSPTDFRALLIAIDMKVNEVNRLAKEHDEAAVAQAEAMVDGGNNVVRLGNHHYAIESVMTNAPGGDA